MAQRRRVGTVSHRGSRSLLSFLKLSNFETNTTESPANGGFCVRRQGASQNDSFALRLACWRWGAKGAFAFGCNTRQIR